MPPDATLADALFSCTFETSATAMAVLAPDSRALRVNPAACQMLGYSAQELMALPPGKLTHPDDWETDRAERQQLLAGTKSDYRRIKRYVHREGGIVWADLTCAVVRDIHGQPLHLMVQVQDLTRQKAAEAALHSRRARVLASHARIREQAALLDHAREAIVLHELDRRIRYWSRGAERMFGFTREVALGRTLDELLGPGGTLHQSARRELLERGQWVGLLECTDAKGRTLTVERHCAVLRHRNGEAAAVLAVNTDVTERHRAEKEIVLLNNALEQRIRRRTLQLQERNSDLRTFAYSLAHDLRAPLSSVDAFSAQLERRIAAQLDETCTHYLSRVRAGVRLMTELTDGLLALANLSNTRLLQQSVDLSALAQGIIERLRERVPEREITVAIQPTPRVEGDVRLLTNMMDNLLGNAWKFTSYAAAPRIEFGAERGSDSRQRYYVRDNGAGFDPAYAAKLFVPFQRLHLSSEFPGTGMGLAIVRKIVARHGGRIWAESRPGEGAVFYFTLHEHGTAFFRSHPTPLTEPD